MCLLVSSRHHFPIDKCFHPHIADTDIACIKVLNSGRESAFRYKKYKLGKQYTANMASKIRKHGYLSMVNRGLHTYVSRAWARKVHGKSILCYRAIIPKGAKFYIGKYGELVSSALIVGERIK